MRRAAKVVGLVAGCVLAALLLAYVGRGLVLERSVDDARERAAAEVADGLESALGATREARRAWAPPGPGQEWAELVCQVVTNDAGWIVQEYVQDCVLRGYALAPADGPAPQRCEQEQPPAAIRDLFAAQDLSVTGWRAGAALDSAAPADADCPAVLRPEVTASYEHRVVVDGERPEGLASGGGGAWTVRQFEVPLSRTVIGCSPWQVPFCGRPGGLPALPASIPSG